MPEAFNPSAALSVLGRDALRGTLRAAPATGDATATIDLADGRRLDVPASLLERRPDGGYSLALGAADAGALSGRAAVESLAAGEGLVIPVAREQLVVEKRVVDTGGVRVRVTPGERREVVEVPLFDEAVEVERVPVNKPAERVTAPRQEGDVTIVPIYEEVLVVEKRLMLKEEVHLRRRQKTRADRQEVTLRQEEVQIEPLPVDASSSTPRPAAPAQTARPA